MKPSINLYSENNYDIHNLLNKYSKNYKYNEGMEKWSHEYDNAVEMIDLIGIILDNNEKYNINIWISLDKNFFINVNDTNSDKIIRYLIERYPI